MLENIKSKKILKIILIMMKRRKILKLLKHNKKLLMTVNMQLKNFKEYQELKEINKKYNLNIEDFDINSLNISYRDDVKVVFESLGKFEFIRLKELTLKENNLQSINLLETIKTNNLEILNLSSNKITNIDLLGKIDFKELKKLDLSENNITKLEVLGNVNFEKLKY